tara:strand:- start:4628 stop:4783 length:156 start_codon:yes stop_codon:yes gene_type:complete
MKADERKEKSVDESPNDSVQLCFSFMKNTAKEPTQLDLFGKGQGDNNGKTD